MSAAAVDRLIAHVVEQTIASGQQPLRVLVSTNDYRALVRRDGLAPRHIGALACSSLRALVCDMDLPVDCDKAMDDGDPMVTAIVVTAARA